MMVDQERSELQCLLLYLNIVDLSIAYGDVVIPKEQPAYQVYDERHSEKRVFVGNIFEGEGKYTVLDGINYSTVWEAALSLVPQADQVYSLKAAIKFEKTIAEITPDYF